MLEDDARGFSLVEGIVKGEEISQIVAKHEILL